MTNYLLRDEVRAIHDRLPPCANCYCIIDTCDIGPFYYATRLDAIEKAQLAMRANADVQFPEAADSDGRAKRPSRYDALHRVEIMSCA